MDKLEKEAMITNNDDNENDNKVPEKSKLNEQKRQKKPNPLIDRPGNDDIIEIHMNDIEH